MIFAMTWELIILFNFILQVLATDEFWPAQGGKAPDLSQVREAIDAILASQRDRSSSSKWDTDRARRRRINHQLILAP